MAGGLEIELTRGRAIEQPGLQHAVGDQRHALGVERPRPAAAPPQRVVDDVDAGREQPLAGLSFRKLVLRAIELLIAPAR